MMLSLDTAYRSFGGEVEASSTPTICRLSDSCRHQLSAIAPLTALSCIAHSVGYGPSRRLSLGTHPQFHDLAPLQEPSSFEDRRHRLLDPRGPRPRLLRAGEVEQVSPLPTRRQRLERALEPRIFAELLLQLLRHGKLWGLRLDLHSGL